MHWLSPYFNMEMKFGPLEVGIKSDWHQLRLIFSEEQLVHPFRSQKD